MRKKSRHSYAPMPLSSLYEGYHSRYDEARTKTFRGASFTLLLCLFMGLVLWIETDYYLSTETISHVSNSLEVEHQIPLNFNMTFPAAHCDELYFELHDASGVVRNINDNVSRVPLLTPFNAQSTRPVQKPKPHTCGSCYGAESNDLQCCESCEDIIRAYLTKGWMPLPLEHYSQCVTEVPYTHEGSGCRVSACIPVTLPKGSLRIHSGPMRSVAGITVLDAQLHTNNQPEREARPDVDVRHSFHHLSFGDTPDTVASTISGFVTPESGHSYVHHYILQAVRTMLCNRNGTVWNHTQYSVARHVKEITEQAPHIPGVYLSYEFSPLLLRVTQRSPYRSIFHFLLYLSSIAAGVYVALSVVESLCHYGMHHWRKKAQIGKQA